MKHDSVDSRDCAKKDLSPEQTQKNWKQVNFHTFLTDITQLPIIQWRPASIWTNLHTSHLQFKVS